MIQDQILPIGSQIYETNVIIPLLSHKILVKFVNNVAMIYNQRSPVPFSSFIDRVLIF